jgi:hypothetical protein
VLPAGAERARQHPDRRWGATGADGTDRRQGQHWEKLELHWEKRQPALGEALEQHWETHRFSTATHQVQFGRRTRAAAGLALARRQYHWVHYSATSSVHPVGNELGLLLEKRPPGDALAVR